MNNQEAIIEGVVRWLDKNRDAALKMVEAGAYRAASEIAESVGVQVAARTGRFLEANKNDFVAGMAAQVALSNLRDDPKYKEKDESAS